MSKRGNITIFIVFALVCVLILIFFFAFKKEVIQVENQNFSKNEQLVEILDMNKQTIKYFIGETNYKEEETYVEITKKLNECGCMDTIIILPAGTIRFFNVPQEGSYAENTGTGK